MVSQMPKLNALPKSLPLEQAICIDLQEGVPIFWFCRARMSE
jgi:hypothetical protein